ncbi:MAG: hypothetical protein INR69_19335 [Mucilaginibacter polytrichastri]|nr:hypothetical protein [Mucilaginibacter polytrichastri]
MKRKIEEIRKKKNTEGMSSLTPAGRSAETRKAHYDIPLTFLPPGRIGRIQHLQNRIQQSRHLAIRYPLTLPVTCTPTFKQAPETASNEIFTEVFAKRAYRLL